MSLQTIEADVAGWAADAASLASSATPVLGEVGDALKAITAVATMFTSFQQYLQTPAMVNASQAAKLQAFSDRINKDLASGSETDLEKLEGQ